MMAKELKVLNREQLFKEAFQDVLDKLEKLGIASNLLMDIALKLFERAVGCSSKTHVCTVVYETTDYEMFRFIEGNREINKTNEKNLKKNFGENGEDYIMNPIIVNEKMEIIDGQHRFKALKELGKPIHYIVVEGIGCDAAQRMNQVSLRWSLLNYVKYHSETDPNCARLYELIKIYNMEKPRGKKLTVTTIYGNVLGHPASSSNQAVKDLLTSNSFKFSEKEYEKAKGKFNIVSEFKKEYKFLSKTAHPDKLLSAIYYLIAVKGCNQTRFSNGLKMMSTQKDRKDLKSGNFKECLNTAYEIYCMGPGRYKKLDIDEINKECHPIARKKGKTKTVKAKTEAG